MSLVTGIISLFIDSMLWILRSNEYSVEEKQRCSVMYRIDCWNKYLFTHDCISMTESICTIPQWLLLKYIHDSTISMIEIFYHEKTRIMIAILILVLQYRWYWWIREWNDPAKTDTPRWQIATRTHQRRYVYCTVPVVHSSSASPSTYGTRSGFKNLDNCSRETGGALPPFRLN